MDALLKQQAEQRGGILDQAAVIGKFLKQIPAFRAVRSRGALVIGKHDVSLLVQGVIVLAGGVQDDQRIVFGLVGPQAAGQMQQHVCLAGGRTAQNQHVPVDQAGAYGQVDAFAHAVRPAQRKQRIRFAVGNVAGDLQAFEYRCHNTPPGRIRPARPHHCFRFLCP